MISETKRGMFIISILVLIVLMGCSVPPPPDTVLPLPPVPSMIEEHEDKVQFIDEQEENTTEPAANPAPSVEPTPPTEEEPQSLFPGGTVLYQQEGLTFEHYFPYTGSLKGDESEILVYNQGTMPIQITSSDMKFIVEGRTYEQYSGTWEKFPSKQSWERIDYINIKPPYYQGQPLILEPGQKGKLHWHYQFAEDIRGKEQAVEIDIAYNRRTQGYTIKKRVVREEDVKE